MESRWAPPHTHTHTHTVTVANRMGQSSTIPLPIVAGIEKTAMKLISFVSRMSSD